jgi:hypothetical protein
MDTLQMPTRAPAFSRSFPAVAGFLDSAWQAATGGWLAGLRGGNSRQLEALRAFVLASLEDSTSEESARLRRRVRLATSVHRMLELREWLFNCVARTRCQSAATKFLVRFDQLAPRRPRAFAHAPRGTRHSHAA